MMRPDLHLHTNCSDGVYGPELLLHECGQRGITHMAVTDHDTMSGSDMLFQFPTDIVCIPGVELSLKDMPGLHLLAYGMTDGALLREKLRTLTVLREERAMKMIDRLAELGMPLSYKELKAKRVLEGGKDGTIGRPHIARAMVRAGYVRNMQEAFAKYIGNDRPAYVKAERMTAAEAIPLVNQVGFLPVLAHPRELKLEEPLLHALLDRLCELGLKGIEVYHPSAASKGFEPLDHMARSRGLLVTGGSDFHQENDGKHGGIGAMIPLWKSSEEDMQSLLSALDEAKKRAESEVRSHGE